MIWLKIMGGILVVLFGFYQLGFFGKSGAMGKRS